MISVKWYLVYMPTMQILFTDNTREAVESIVSKCKHYSGYSDVYKILSDQHLKELEWEF